MKKEEAFLKKTKEKLEKRKNLIENSLEGFAKKDKKIKGDWDTRFPKFNSDNLEEMADEVEEYENLLPVEYSLEEKLKDIDIALEKIKNKKYGKCENCNKDIPKNRLIVYPEARKCNNCS